MSKLINHIKENAKSFDSDFYTEPKLSILLKDIVKVLKGGTSDNYKIKFSESFLADKDIFNFITNAIPKLELEMEEEKEYPTLYLMYEDMEDEEMSLQLGLNCTSKGVYFEVTSEGDGTSTSLADIYPLNDGALIGLLKPMYRLKDSDK